MDYRAIEKELGVRNYFPNTSSVAYFSPNSQTIHLNRISRADIANRSTVADYSPARSEIATIFHEITHWADVVATVWGRNHLSRVYDAIRLLDHVETSGAEYEFWKFAELHDEERRLMLPKYYRTVHPDAQPHDRNKRWGIQFSAGREFDSAGKVDDTRPILFVKFLDRDAGKPIIRQPLTVGSLLEANAVWSEISAGYEVVGSLENGVRQVEQRVMEQELLKTLYADELTLYTAPAHLLAHYASVSDVALGYRLSSAVAHLVLNFLEEHYQALTPPPAMDPWHGLFAGFKSRRNPAFAYAVICARAPAWDDNVGPDVWLNSALNAAGLPSSDDIYLAAEDEIRRQAAPETASPLGQTQQYLLDIGRDIFAARRIDNDSRLTLGKAIALKLPTPPMFDADGEVCLTAGSTFDLAKFDPTGMHQAEWALDKWTRNFLSSCR